MSEPGPIASSAFDFSKDYVYAEDLEDTANAAHYAVLQFQKPVTCSPDALIIASRLDTDVTSNTVCFYFLLPSARRTRKRPLRVNLFCHLPFSSPLHQCRLVFHGRMVAHAGEKEDTDAWLKRVQVTKWKERRGQVERLVWLSSIFSQHPLR